MITYDLMLVKVYEDPLIGLASKGFLMHNMAVI